jgi:N-acetylglucosaminyldiphosphoundecaprenol N-acetyl-beta-D-mannosaminyltransferase
MTLPRQRVPLLEVDATPVTVDELTDLLAGFIAEGGTKTIVGHNLHSVTLLHSDPVFRSFYEQSDVVLIDGAPVLWLWAKSLEGDGAEERAMDYRLGSTDWIPALANVKGLERIAVVGAGSQANEQAVARLQDVVRHARVDGLPGEGWNEELEARAVAWLGELRPQLVLLGLGMPLQEQVLQRNRDALPPAVYCTVGGAIEQIAGIQKLAPRWIGRLGLEWAWRLLLHPKRVAYRVFGEPWVLMGLLIRRQLRERLNERRQLRRR